jgi:acylphosphatase
MKKLITLANFATGTVKNIVNGEVKTVAANLSEKERIKLMAKNIAELHNAGIKNLLREEEEENIFPKKKDF